MLTVRFFAGARAAAGVPEESVPVTVAPAGGARRDGAPSPAPPSLDELASDLAERHGPRLRQVLTVASFLVDGVAWHDRQAPLPVGATVDVLPPFAGG